jgi:hypothetical protein
MILSRIFQALLLSALVVDTGVVEARLGEAIRLKVLSDVYHPTQRTRFLKQLIGLGGSPPSSAFPLQECEGDCDTDDDVSVCSSSTACQKRRCRVSLTRCLLKMKYITSCHDYNQTHISVTESLCAFRETLGKQFLAVREILIP